MIDFPPPGTRVALYVRSASVLQAAGPAEDQLVRCYAYAEQHGWVIAETYTDDCSSGASLGNREGLFRLMWAAERGEFDVVLMENLNRLSPKAGDVVCIVEELDEANIKVCTVADGIIFGLGVAFRSFQYDLRVRKRVGSTQGAAG